MILRSIRWRIQAWHGALLVVVVTGFGLTAYRLASADRLRQVDEALQADVAQLAVAVPPAANERGALPHVSTSRPPPPPAKGVAMETMPADHYYVVWRVDGQVQVRSSNAPVDLVRPAPPSEAVHTARTKGSMREFYRYTNAGRCFLVGRSIASEITGLHRLAWYLAAAGTGVLAIGLVGGGWLAARAIRPIAEISATAESIAAGNLSKRISSGDADNELNRLAGVLNSTFSRLEAAFTQQARFSADAAHELRTPVSVMLTHVQNGLADEGLSVESREAFEACERAAQRMRRLIDSLLELTRLDAGQEHLHNESVDLAQIARDGMELVEPLAGTRGILLHVDLQVTPCRGDAIRLAQVVTNLLTNAIEHNCEGGEVRLITYRSQDRVHLSVADNGSGIAAADLPHIFERFYRADVARSGGSAHAGLGLAISKAIVEAHGGTLEASNQESGGAVFTLHLPMRQ